MKKILAAALVAGSAALAPLTAAAGPLYTLYQFEVQSWGCVTGGPACGGSYSAADLGRVNIGVIGTNATLGIETRWDSYPYAGGGPFNYSNVAVAALDSIGTPLDFERQACMSSYICTVNGTFTVGADGSLTGSLSTLNDADMFEMSSDGTSLWTGKYISDNGHQTSSLYIVYSGVWRAVPEPATLALFGAGLVGLIGLRRRKA